MNTNLLITFIVLSIVNVIIQTVKSIVTVKGGKVLASVVNAIAFGLYTVVTVYTMCDLPLALKAFIVAMTNLVGVYIVKAIEEKTRKDKLWEIRLTCKNELDIEEISNGLTCFNIPFNTVKADGIADFRVFNIYCATQKESLAVKELIKNREVKYFISENKATL